MHNYSQKKEHAIKQLLDMNNRAKKSYTNTQTPDNTNAYTPFSQVPLDSDTLKILAIMLLLYNENCDFLLIFALVYILL